MIKLSFILVYIFLCKCLAANLFETLDNSFENDLFYSILKNNNNNSNITIETSAPPLDLNETNIIINKTINITDLGNTNDSSKKIMTILLSTFGGIIGYFIISLTIYKILKVKEIKKNKKKENERIKKIAETIECVEVDDVIV